MARRDPYATPFGAAYSAYMERPRIGRAIGRVVWGGDSRRYYESMDAVTRLPDGATVVDCPCGAGPALRAVRPGAGLRYLAIDLSPAMLGRARTRAEARGLSGIEFVEADATDVPLPSSCADLFLSFWGLHVFDDPPAALAEAARIIRPSGRLVGACFVRGRGSLRQRLLIRPDFGGFGPLGTESEVEAWVAAAGLLPAERSRSGPMLFFEATAPGRS
jgi:ubiquinone/menaquinone biosynthesis C-methylase UbiE